MLGNGKLQNRFGKYRNIINSTMQEHSEELSDKDDGIYHQTFTHHWEACRDRIREYEPDSNRCSDDILTIAAQLGQMIQLLQLELSNNNAETRILDTILSDSDSILAQVSSIIIVTIVTNTFFCRLLAGQKVFRKIKMMQF